MTPRADGAHRVLKILSPLVPFWYHDVMAMNLRVPEDLDRRLEKLAAEEHTSKSADLLTRLEDA